MDRWTNRVFLYFAMVMNFLWSWAQLMDTWNVHEPAHTKFCAVLMNYFG